MASILDDLNGILTQEQIAQINGNAALKARIDKGDELYSYYAGEEPPVQQQQQQQPPVQQQQQQSNHPFDLGAIERMFDKKLGDINKTIEEKVGDVVKARGDELVNNAVKIAVQRTDELSRLYSRAQEVTGKPLDSKAFNEFLELEENKGRFRTIEEAGTAYLAPQVRERDINAEVQKRIQAQSGSHVPGSTPPPSTNSNIAFFKKRSAPGESGQTTGAQRAAEALQRKLNADQAIA